MDVSAGAIDNMVHRVCQSRQMRQEYSRIKQLLREDEVIGCDETGMRINADHGYLWIF